MGNIYSRISDWKSTKKGFARTPIQIDFNSKFTCWRCGGENVVPSSFGDDMKEMYYCHDCKEHLLNPERGYLQ